MSNKNATKRALVTGTLAILACIAMLIGATFAWFTDTASTAVNKIVSGNLKVGFQYWNGTEYVDASDVSLFSENTLWEPGHTEIVYLKVINKGDLALKYKLSTVDTFEYRLAKNSDGETILLSEFLKIGIAENKNAAEGTFANREEAIAAAADNLVAYNSYTKENTLRPATSDSESADYLAFVVYMPTTVGNKANAVDSTNLPWIRFALALSATQASYEQDSFDDTYDENVPYPVISTNAQKTGDELRNQLGNRVSDIVLGGDATGFYAWTVKDLARLDLNGKTIKATGSAALLDIENGGDLTVVGSGTVDASAADSGEHIFGGTAVRVQEGGKLTVEGGTFIGKENCSCIYNAGGEVVIKGGFFKCTGPDTNGTYFVLNQENGNPGTIKVMGGTFVNYDPRTGDDNLGGNFVENGYKVVTEEQANGDIWYTVVAE